MSATALEENSLLNPRLKRCYDDVKRKTMCIINKFDVINSMHKKMVSQLPGISESDANILCGEISDCFEKMYSCMEYVAAILRELFRERGSIEASFHKLLKKTVKNKDITNIYSDPLLRSFILQTISWYAIVHDIRSEEAHFTMGTLRIKNGSVLYCINKQTGRETVYDLIQILNNQPKQPITVYTITIKDLETIYIGFLTSINQLGKVIINLIDI